MEQSVYQVDGIVRPTRGPVGAVSDVDRDWIHSSGIHLPRGCVVHSEASEDDLARLARSSAARGVREHALIARNHLKRRAAETQQLQVFTEWLSCQGLDLFGAVSFTDEYAARHGIYSLSRALDDVWVGLNDVPMKRGRIKGFPGKFVLAGEWHPSGRSVPHVHLALESGSAPGDAVCNDLWRYFFHTRGRSRFEPMRDQNVATLYALKDSVKASTKDADSVRFRMWRPKRRAKS